MGRIFSTWIKSLASCAAVALVFPIAAAGAAPLPAALGPEAPFAQTSGGFVGSVTVTPTHGPVGTPVTVKADGLPANSQVQIVWRTVKGSWNVGNGEYHGRDFAPVGYQIATLTSDANGVASANFVVPEDFGFTHDVVVQEGDRLLSQTGFYVDMTVDVSPKSGPVGQPITVDVKGIGWRQLHNSWLLLYDNNFTGWISSVSTGGSARFTIPATGEPGLHMLEVLHGGFTFAYRNMQQSPEPERPQFAIPFTITAGGAILPPSPDQQVQTEIRSLPAAGQLEVTPRFSPVDKPVTVSGTGFEPGKVYQLNWTTVTGNRVSGGGWEESSKVIAKATSDDKGNLSFDVNTPDDLGGAHRLWVDDGGSKKSGTLWIQPTAMPLDVDHGPVGTTFTIHLKGVGWTETANIFTIDYDNSFIGYSCGFNSQGDVVIHLYATGQPGRHYVDLYPAIYKGKETGPNNFRLPQLTYAADHPGEDLPHFRFAFNVVETVN